MQIELTNEQNKKYQEKINLKNKEIELYVKNINNFDTVIDENTKFKFEINKLKEEKNLFEQQIENFKNDINIKIVENREMTLIIESKQNESTKITSEYESKIYDLNNDIDIMSIKIKELELDK